MTLATDSITAMKNDTTYNKVASEKNSSSSGTTSSTDENTFLTLMLQEMQNQDPTQPMDNQQWLSQLAQYSSLEQMTAVNKNLTSMSSTLSSLSDTIGASSSINQTLSLIGKNVDITDPKDSTKTITGTVSEASFNDGVGQVKVNGTNYPISYIKTIRNADTSGTSTTSTTSTTNSTTTDKA